MTRYLPFTMLACLLSACVASLPGTPVPPAETDPTPKAEQENPPEPISDRQTVTADQVMPAASGPDEAETSTLQQLSAPDDGRVLGMQVVEESDPCLEDTLRDKEQCRNPQVSASGPRQAHQQPEITLRIMRPDESATGGFDPDRTVDEIGRNTDQLSSAAQFLGADLLAPVHEPEETERDSGLDPEQGVAAGILLMPPPTQ